MPQAQTFYDRVEVYIDGQPYLPEGLIQNCTISMRTESKLVNGMTTTGIKPGQVQGNTEIDFDWTELLPAESQFVNWYTFMRNNPNTEITIIPISIATNVQSAVQHSITGIIVLGQTEDARGSGAEMTRRVTFQATTASGFNI